MLVQSTCTFPSAQSLMRFSEFSRVHSQGFFLVLYFPGLTKEEAKNCIRIETKKRFLFVKKTKVEHRCTTNKLSEKYEGNSTLLAVTQWVPTGHNLSAISHLAVTALLFYFIRFIYLPQSPMCGMEGANQILVLLKTGQGQYFLYLLFRLSECTFIDSSYGPNPVLDIK